MNTLFSRLRQAFPFVTERCGTDDDFYSYCDDNRIEVVHNSQINHGIYVVRGGEHFIFLNSRLTGWMQRYVMFHELGHYLFHVPSLQKPVARSQEPEVGSAIYGFTSGRNHAEAEATAAYMLLTVPELENALLDGEFRRNERLAGLIATRLELYREYGA